MTHFLPEEGTYVFFRYDDEQKGMVVFNKNSEETSLGLERFSEMLKGATSGKDILTGKNHSLDNNLQVPARGVTVLELD